MQHDLVVLEGKGPEDLPLERTRVGQDVERLVCVTGEDHVVEALAVDLDVPAAAPHAAHGGARADPVPKRPHQGLHVPGRATLDDPPLGLVVHGQHPVVLEEADEELRRHLQNAPPRHGPQGRAHRDQIVVDEPAREGGPVDVLAQGELGGSVPNGLSRLAVEAQDVRDHRVESRAHQIASLGEERAEGRAAPLHAGPVAADAEAHVRGLAGHAETPQELAEERVVVLVVYDEPGVDRVSHTVGPFDLHRVDVPPDPVPRLEDRDLVPLVQE